MIGAVGSIRLHTVGDAGDRGADEISTALCEAEHHLFETVVDNRERILLVGAEPAACRPVVGSVDACFTVI